MIEIPLTRGYVAIIDDEDHESAARNWYAVTAPNGRVYATRQIKVRGKKIAIFLHREIAERQGHDLTKRPGERRIVVDHRDGDGLNCRRKNLLVTNQSVNLRNTGIRCTNTSGFHGVQKHGDRWIARIRIDDGKRLYLGRFKTAEEANAARLAAEREHWGIEPRRAEAHAPAAA